MEVQELGESKDGRAPITAAQIMLALGLTFMNPQTQKLSCLNRYRDHIKNPVPSASPIVII